MVTPLGMSTGEHLNITGCPRVDPDGTPIGQRKGVRATAADPAESKVSRRLIPSVCRSHGKTMTRRLRTMAARAHAGRAATVLVVAG